VTRAFLLEELAESRDVNQWFSSELSKVMQAPRWEFVISKYHNSSYKGRTAEQNPKSSLQKRDSIACNIVADSASFNTESISTSEMTTVFSHYSACGLSQGEYKTDVDHVQYKGSRDPSVRGPFEVRNY
jgi:hypothetical protein